MPSVDNVKDFGTMESVDELMSNSDNRWPINWQGNNAAFVNGGPHRDRKVGNCPVPPSYRGFNVVGSYRSHEVNRRIPPTSSNIDTTNRRIQPSTLSRQRNSTVITTADWRLSKNPTLQRLIQQRLRDDDNTDSVESVPISLAPATPTTTPEYSTSEPQMRLRGDVRREVNREASRMQSSDDGREDLADLVRQQKRARAEAQKWAEDQEKERINRITANLAATAAAAKRAAERSPKHSFDLLRTKPSTQRGVPSGGCNSNVAIRRSHEVPVPPECVARAAELLAEEAQDVRMRKRQPNGNTTVRHSVNHHQPTAAASPNTYLATRSDLRLHNTSYCPHMVPSIHGLLDISHPRGDASSNYRTRECSVQTKPHVSTSAILSKSLPTKSKVVNLARHGVRGFDSENQIAVHASGPPATLGTHRYSTVAQTRNERAVVATPSLCTLTVDAESEQARLQARLCAGRARRFVQLSEGPQYTGAGDVTPVSPSSSEVSASDSDLDGGEASVTRSSLHSHKWYQLTDSRVRSEFAGLSSTPNHLATPVGQRAKNLPRSSDIRLNAAPHSQLSSMSRPFELAPRNTANSKTATINNQGGPLLFSERDPLRFMTIYKKRLDDFASPSGDSPGFEWRLRRNPTGSETVGTVCASAISPITRINEVTLTLDSPPSPRPQVGAVMRDEDDKTSEAASSLPSLDETPVANHSEEEEEEEEAAAAAATSQGRANPQAASEARIVPAALGLSLSAELHRFEALASSEQHVMGMESSRNAAVARDECIQNNVQFLQTGFLQSVHRIISPIADRSTVTSVREAAAELVSAVCPATVCHRQTLAPALEHTKLIPAKMNINQVLFAASNTPVPPANAARPAALLPRVDATLSHIEIDTSSTPIPPTPSCLDRSSAMSEISQLNTQQFKGILKKRASDLDARRQEAQRLLQFAAKLDREELKVAALESKAMKALTKPPIRRRQLDTLKLKQSLQIGHEKLRLHLQRPHPRSSSLSSTTSKSLVQKKHIEGFVGNGPPPGACKPTPRRRLSIMALDGGKKKTEGGTWCPPVLGSPTPEMDSFPDGSRDMHQVRALSVASSGTVSELSEVETRLACLQANLREQQEILTKIDKGCQRAHKDGLIRLENTLLEHKKFCTEIIDKITSNVVSCQSSLLVADESVSANQRP